MEKQKVYDKIDDLSKNSKILNNKKDNLRRITGDLEEVISDFKDAKRSFSKAQAYIDEGDTSIDGKKQVQKLGENINDINKSIDELENVKIEVGKEIRQIDEKVQENEKQIKRLNEEAEEIRKKETNNEN